MSLVGISTGLPWRTYDQKFCNKQLLIFGYGVTGNDGGYSKKLLSIELKLLSHKECEGLFNAYVTEDPEDPPLVYPDKYDRKTYICAKSGDEIPRSACNSEGRIRRGYDLFQSVPSSSV